MLDTINKTIVPLQVGYGLNEVITDPSVKNAVLQLLIMLVTWGFHKITNKKQ